MATSADRILKQFADQAVACEQLGSRFTAQLCRVLAARLDIGTRFGRRIFEWPGDPYADNVALRAAGALHALARSGWEPTFSELYPPHKVSDLALWAGIVDVLSRHSSFLTDRLDSPPQTNEVARSGLILGGMLAIADVTRLPLEIYEIGSSAGLNLGFDQYGYALGGKTSWGPANAPLLIDCAWRGGTMPLAAPLQVVGRHGCDLNPIDPQNPADRERLLSYVWADQTHRLERIEAALRLAAAEHRSVERAEAADWLEAQFATPQPAGVTRVLVSHHRLAISPGRLEGPHRGVARSVGRCRNAGASAGASVDRGRRRSGQCPHRCDPVAQRANRHARAWRLPRPLGRVALGTGQADSLPGTATDGR